MHSVLLEFVYTAVNPFLVCEVNLRSLGPAEILLALPSDLPSEREKNIGQ